MKKSSAHGYVTFALALLITCFVNITSFAQQFLGVTNYGGTGTGGTIYSIPYSGTGYANVNNFTVDIPGGSPQYEKLCLSPTGKLFGTARTGGLYNKGVIFSYDPASTAYTVVKDLNTTDGINPYSGLFLASDGKFYGMTYSGGANNVGTIYKYDESTGIYTKLYDFIAANGCNPFGRFMQATNGLLYGTTYQGGSNNLGVLFSFDPATNAYTKLYDFNNANGSSPYNTVVEYAGSLYGMTSTGGANSVGVIYQWNIGSSTYTLKHSFITGTEGANPYGTLVKAANNKLYGMTNGGGTIGYGTIFEYVTTTNIFTNKYNFNYTNGANPYGEFELGTNGKYYGVTYSGGNSGLGAIFNYDYVTNTYTHVASSTSTVARYPIGSLVQHTNGKMYGVSNSGGNTPQNYIVGDIFEFDPSPNTITQKQMFEYSVNGKYSNASTLILASDGNYYGTTQYGGLNNMGVLYKYNLSSGIYTKLFDFIASTGSYPQGCLIQATDGNIYGVTSSGGSGGYGVLFKYNIGTSTYSVSRNFSASVYTPTGGIMQASTGKIYGVGTQLWSWDISTSTFSGLYNVGATYCVPVEANNNTIWGCSYSNNTIWSWNIGTNTGTITYNFSSGTGNSPQGSMIVGATGNLFGLTYSGGASGYGVLFEYDYVNNVYYNRHSFNNSVSDGGNPTNNTPILALDGNIYGVTKGGGANGVGTMFKWNYSTFSTVYSFAQGTGYYPTGSFIEVSCTAPTQPGTITGNTTVCQNSSNTYSISPVSGATSYTWLLPSGWSGSSTTTSINATASATSGNISVTANNACGGSTPRTLAVTVTPVPSQPGTITGNATVCSGSNNTYSISPVSGATSYTWVLPSGWTGTSTTTSINTTASSTSGNVTVTANNACGASTAQSLTVTVSPVPATPGAISGNTTVCQTSTNTYSISPVSGATSYTWVLPSGWTGSSSTTSINATASATSGNITVTANNACGTSSPQTLAVTVTPTPSQPGAISGNTTVCQTSSNTYSISPVSGATSYTWVLPSGWTGSSSTTSINATASATSGNITVTANNACGASAPQTLAVTVTPTPTQPGSISGNTTVCQNSNNTYSIAPVSGATSYTWVLPSGWTGSSSTTSINTTASATSGNITVTANNACGASTPQTLAVTVSPAPATPGTISGNTTVCQSSNNTYSIAPVSGATSYTWVLPSGWTGSSSTTSINTTASATSGNITVTANNACGSSSPQTLAVTVSPTPSQPGSISGNTTVCQNSSNTYSIAPVSGATSYTWVLPSGWTGSSSTTSINATSSATSGNITVTANNACGSSAPQTLAVTVVPLPATPGTISGNNTVCQNSSNTYSIAPVSGATSYTWVLPSGWSGSSTTTSINATAGASGGNITVTANNACGSSAAQILVVIVNTLPTVTYTQTPNSMCVNWPIQNLSPASPPGGTYSGPGVNGTQFDPATAGVGTWNIVYSFTNINGCTNTATQQITVGLCTGVENNNMENGVNVYPNPFSSSLILNVTETGAQAILYNTIGAQVGSWKLENGENSIDTHELAAGIYMMRVMTSNGVITKKVIKE